MHVSNFPKNLWSHCSVFQAHTLAPFKVLHNMAKLQKLAMCLNGNPCSQELPRGTMSTRHCFVCSLTLACPRTPPKTKERNSLFDKPMSMADDSPLFLVETPPLSPPYSAVVPYKVAFRPASRDPAVDDTTMAHEQPKKRGKQKARKKNKNASSSKLLGHSSKKSQCRVLPVNLAEARLDV